MYLQLDWSADRQQIINTRIKWQMCTYLCSILSTLRTNKKYNGFSAKLFIRGNLIICECKTKKYKNNDSNYYY